MLARQGVKRTQKAFSRELAEMVRYAVGYRSRAIVTFGKPLAIDGVDPTSRSEVLELAHTIMRAIGRLHKVLPTAVIANAMRPSITRRELSRAQTLCSTRCVRRAPTSVFTPAPKPSPRRSNRSRRAASSLLSADVPCPRSQRPPLLRPHA